MSRAFVKENDLEHAGIDIPERPLSDEPNYVTPNGLKLLNTQIDALEIEREELKNKKDDPIAKQKIAIVERDMRYYAARIESAILTAPSEEDHSMVLFGAKVTVEDEEGKYVNSDSTLNAYNASSETLTAGQIEYYITESATDEGVVLPTVVQTAITKYLTPVMTRYENTYMQRELIFKLMEDSVFTDSTDAARFNTIREINRRQLSEYLLSTTGYFDQNYDNLYGSWFDILEN